MNIFFKARTQKQTKKTYFVSKKGDVILIVYINNFNIFVLISITCTI